MERDARRVKNGRGGRNSYADFLHSGPLDLFMSCECVFFCRASPAVFYIFVYGLFELLIRTADASKIVF